MDRQLIFGTVVPGTIAIIVVLGWVIAVAAGLAGADQLQDPAIAILGVIFGATIHSAGVSSVTTPVTGLVL